jgi:tetratricopeptide (TPR) repeat protein
MLIRSLLLALPLLLAGCAAAPPAPPPQASLLRDAAFGPPSVTIDPAQAWALSPAMLAFASGPMAAEVRNKGLRDGLIDALYTKGRLQLDYDAERTRSAAEAFDARRGNCLSLVLMTAAFARHLNLPVRFNSVYLQESWSRSGGLFFVSGHVNVSLGRQVGSQRTVFGESELMTIDFLPPEQMRGQRSRVVDESTVLAMFLNNRAAEALTSGRLDDAYAWARAAVQADSRWLAAYNTLAVLYRRKGLHEAAEAALRHVLADEALNAQALSNLVLVLSDQGRPAEAQVYANQLAQVQPIPPYQFFDRGMAAMRSGEYAVARQLFRQEIARSAYVPEFHFWLGLAQYGLGDVSAARGQIAKALEHSTTVNDRELYGAKLAWLNEQRRR